MLLASSLVKVNSTTSLYLNILVIIGSQYFSDYWIWFNHLYLKFT